jgi:hypothetical protein
LLKRLKQPLPLLRSDARAGVDDAHDHLSVADRSRELSPHLFRRSAPRC